MKAIIIYESIRDGILTAEINFPLETKTGFSGLKYIEINNIELIWLETIISIDIKIEESDVVKCLKVFEEKYPDEKIDKLLLSAFENSYYFKTLNRKEGFIDIKTRKITNY